MRHSVDEAGDPALAWLMAISNFKDEAPWLYEVGLDIYRAHQRGDGPSASRAIDVLSVYCTLSDEGLSRK